MRIGVDLKYMNKAFGIYVLQSLKNNRYYIGSTNEMNRRLTQHNRGYVRATRNIKPLELKVFINQGSLKKARSGELRLKRYKSRIILEKVIADGRLPWEYKES